MTASNKVDQRLTRQEDEKAFKFPRATTEYLRSVGNAYGARLNRIANRLKTDMFTITVPGRRRLTEMWKESRNALDDRERGQENAC